MAPKDAAVKITYKKIEIKADLGAGPAQITDGYGGWEEIDRPSDLSITHWSGQTPRRMTIPIFLDGYRENDSVQKELDKLLTLGRSRDGDEEPPVFRVSGPIPFSGERWVMESSPEMGESFRAKDGRLLRQALTLSLMEYVKGDRIKIKRRKGKTYTTKKGDTLLKIARKLEPKDNNKESIKYAKEIGKLNKIRDIRKKLKAGIKLRLP